MGEVRTHGRRSEPPGAAGVITALRVRKGLPDRVAVHLDGKFSQELATGLVEQAGLRLGTPLSEEVLERLWEQDAPFRARSRCLRLLGSRDRSRREIESLLGAAGYDPEVVNGTVCWLRGLGYLDDGRFAVRYAADKLRAGWAERRVRAELGRRGVDPGLIAEALEAGGAGDPTVKAMSDSLMATVRRRFGPQFARDPKAAERRLAGFLARRGYDWEEISRVVRTLRLENGAPAGADRSDDPGGLPALDLGGESDP